MSRGRPYEVVECDREGGTITMFDRDTNEMTTVRPLGTELFDAYEAWQRGEDPIADAMRRANGTGTET